MRALFAIMKKDLLLLSRDRAALVLLFVMPAALALVITLVQENVFKTVGGVLLEGLLVDHDGGAVAKELVLRETGLRIGDGEALRRVAGHFEEEWRDPVRRKRLPPLRRKVLARTRGICATPGCGNPAEHLHLACRGCGKVIEYEHPLISELVRAVQHEQDFSMTRAEFYLEGYCQQCRKSGGHD